MPLSKEQFKKARDAGYSVEQIIEFENKRMGEQPQQQNQVNSQETQSDKSSVENQNILGRTFNVPGATSRAAIRSKPALAVLGPLAGMVALKGAAGKQAQKMAAQGALNPSQVQSFQEQAIIAGQKALGGPSKSVFINFAKGLLPSVAGLGADMATDPASVLLQLLGSSAVKNMIRPGNAKAVGSVVKKPFMKSMKPSLRGRKNYRRLSEIAQQAESAVESIVDNKAGLQFTDDIGNVIKGKLPESVDDFSQSISQTKKVIFNKYDAMVKETGKSGLKINLKPIANEILDAVAKPGIEDLSPTVQNYGLQLAGRLEKRGSYGLVEAQDIIESLNNKLKSFFINPTPESAHQAVIDRCVVNNLRKQLVEVVESAGNPKFSVLRKQYGALNAIEENVTKMALHESKKSIAGLGSLFDIFSAGDIVNGMVNLNPSQITKGVFQIGARKAFAAFNNPNRIIKNIFVNVDKIKNVDPAKRALLNVLKKTSATIPVSARSIQGNQ